MDHYSNMKAAADGVFTGGVVRDIGIMLDAVRELAKQLKKFKRSGDSYDFDGLYRTYEYKLAKYARDIYDERGDKLWYALEDHLSFFKGVDDLYFHVRDLDDQLKILSDDSSYFWSVEDFLDRLENFFKQLKKDVERLK